MKKTIASILLVLAACLTAGAYPAVLFNPTNGAIVIPTNLSTGITFTSTNYAGNGFGVTNIQASNIAANSGPIPVGTLTLGNTNVAGNLLIDVVAGNGTTNRWLTQNAGNLTNLQGANVTGTVASATTAVNSAGTGNIAETNIISTTGIFTPNGTNAVNGLAAAQVTSGNIAAAGLLANNTTGSAATATNLANYIISTTSANWQTVLASQTNNTWVQVNLPPMTNYVNYIFIPPNVVLNGSGPSTVLIATNTPWIGQSGPSMFQPEGNFIIENLWFQTGTNQNEGQVGSAWGSVLLSPMPGMNSYTGLVLNCTGVTHEDFLYNFTGNWQPFAVTVQNCTIQSSPPNADDLVNTRNITGPLTFINDQMIGNGPTNWTTSGLGTSYLAYSGNFTDIGSRWSGINLSSNTVINDVFNPVAGGTYSFNGSTFVCPGGIYTNIFSTNGNVSGSMVDVLGNRTVSFTPNWIPTAFTTNYFTNYNMGTLTFSNGAAPYNPMTVYFNGLNAWTNYVGGTNYICAAVYDSGNGDGEYLEVGAGTNAIQLTNQVSGGAHFYIVNPISEGGVFLPQVQGATMAVDWTGIGTPPTPWFPIASIQTNVVPTALVRASTSGYADTPTAVTVGGSPFNFTNVTTTTLECYFTDSAAYSVAKNGTTVFSSLAVDGYLLLQPNGKVTLTYSSTTPTMNTNAW